MAVRVWKNNQSGRHIIGGPIGEGKDKGRWGYRGPIQVLEEMHSFICGETRSEGKGVEDMLPHIRDEGEESTTCRLSGREVVLRWRVSFHLR